MSMDSASARRVWLKCGDKVRFDTEEFVIDELVDPNATKLRPNDSQRAVIEPAHKDAPSSSASRQRPGAKIVEPQSRTFQIPAGDLLKHLAPAQVSVRTVGARRRRMP